MMTLATSITYNEKEMALLSALIHERTGNHYPADKYDLLASKLEFLLFEKNLGSFVDFYYLLKYDADPNLWQQVQNALAVNETYFWREYEAIRFAVEVLIPNWQIQRPGQPVRIWHAGCASGEEPYTMAISLMEAGRFAFGPIEIIGTDFNTTALARARAGLYRQTSFRAMPENLRARYFEPVQTPPWHYRLRPVVRSKVRFQYLNLIETDKIDALGKFDLIYCRNVFIYFSEEVIKKIIDAFYEVLQPDGLLFTGAAESLLRLTDRFELTPAGKTFGYRKTG